MDNINNVLVIGNGYDIAHGLKTRYSDFIDWVRNLNGDYSKLDTDDVEFKNRIYDNGFIRYFLSYTNEVCGWVDLEHLIKDMVHYFERFISEYRQILRNKEGGIQRKYDYWVKHAVGFSKIFERKESESYYLKARYYSYDFGLNKAELLRILKEELDDVIKLMKIYLEQFSGDKVFSNLQPIKQIADIHPQHVISFNYTETYKIYGIKPDEVYHIHGSLAKNNMVLGFDDETSGNLDFIYFKKYFQRIQKLTGYVDPNKWKPHIMGVTGGLRIFFYGLSMDKTDGDMIRKLWDDSHRFVIFYYSQSDYEQKVINLIDVFGKDIITEIQEKNITFIQCEK